MEYQQKMVVPTFQKYKHEDDDDEDLEALRLAALKSLKGKNVAGKNSSGIQPTSSQSFVGYTNNQIHNRKKYYQQNPPMQRQNGNIYYPSRNNQNLIEIIPVEENTNLQDEVKAKEKTDEIEETKFRRFSDNLSGTDDEEGKESVTKSQKNGKLQEISEVEHVEKKIENESDKISGNLEEIEMHNEEDFVEEETNDDGEVEEQEEEGEGEGEEDDDDEEVEEEEEDEEEEDEEEEDEEEEEVEKIEDDDDDILLMADHEEEDSLERLMNEMEKEINVDKPVVKKEKKLSKKDSKCTKNQKESPEISKNSKNSKNSKTKVENFSNRSYKNESRMGSPYRMINKRKKSPRRSPSRQMKLSHREITRYSPLRRSPTFKYTFQRSSKSPTRLSPPARSPTRRSPRRISPRNQRSSLSRSPRRRSRSRSPRNTIRSKSPRYRRSKSPKNPVGNLSPRSRNNVSPQHRQSPILRSNSKLSPKRSSPSRISPHRSPWSSPKHSPWMSPRRRRSPGKDLPKKSHRSTTPEDATILFHKKEKSPNRFDTKSKSKSGNPILEARRRKFESVRPIDPINDNKKIKLTKKEQVIESVDIESEKKEIVEKYDQDEELSINLSINEDCTFDEEFETELNDETSISSGIKMCVDVTKVKVEKERIKKKKKKDKEIYQIGKIKELPLSERIGKEKKCKKRRDYNIENIKEDTELVSDDAIDEETDLRAELSRRRAERLNRTAPIQSARLLQSAFKGVVNDVVKNNAKIGKKHVNKSDDKSIQKDIRRVTVLHRSASDVHDNSEDETTIDSKVPVRFRLGLNKPVQEMRDSKTSRKSSKRQGRKVKQKSNLLAGDNDRK